MVLLNWVNIKFIIKLKIKLIFLLDDCDQQSESCCCTNKFHNDHNHQYVLSNSHRLIAKKRLDLIALMQNDILLTSPVQQSPPLNRNPFVSVSCRKFSKNK
jgi:hypothetical protein